MSTEPTRLEHDLLEHGVDGITADVFTEKQIAEVLDPVDMTGQARSS